MVTQKIRTAVQKYERRCMRDEFAVTTSSKAETTIQTNVSTMRHQKRGLKTPEGPR